MNRLAIWVARTAVDATAPTALAQATASPFPAIAAAVPGLTPTSPRSRSVIPGCVTKTVLFRCRRGCGIDKSSRA